METIWEHKGLEKSHLLHPAGSPVRNPNPYPLGNIHTAGPHEPPAPKGPSAQLCTTARGTMPFLRHKFFSCSICPCRVRVIQQELQFASPGAWGTRSSHPSKQSLRVLSLCEQHLAQAATLSCMVLPRWPSLQSAFPPRFHPPWSYSSINIGRNSICQQQFLHFSSRLGCRTSWTRSLPKLSHTLLKSTTWSKKGLTVLHKKFPLMKKCGYH